MKENQYLDRFIDTKYNWIIFEIVGYKDMDCEKYMGWITAEALRNKRTSILWIEGSNNELQT